MEINSIHNEFHKILFHFISSRVKSKEDASDILQEVFIKISAKLGSLADSRKLKSWIFTITRNAIIDYYRKNAIHKTSGISEIMIEEQVDEDYIDTTKGLDKCLKSYIRMLPAEYREIIIDSELKGIKQKDLAHKYEMPYSSIRSRVQRGRKRLKDMLLKCCKIEADSRGNILESDCHNNCGDCD